MHAFEYQLTVANCQGMDLLWMHLMTLPCQIMVELDRSHVLGVIQSNLQSRSLVGHLAVDLGVDVGDVIRRRLSCCVTFLAKNGDPELDWEKDWVML